MGLDAPPSYLICFRNKPCLTQHISFPPFYCGCPCSLLEFTNYYQVPRTRELIKLFFFRKAMCTKDIVLCLYCRVACCLTTQLCLLAYFCYYLFFSVIVQWIDNNVSNFELLEAGISLDRFEARKWQQGTYSADHRIKRNLEPSTRLLWLHAESTLVSCGYTWQPRKKTYDLLLAHLVLQLHWSAKVHSMDWIRILGYRVLVQDELEWPCLLRPITTKISAAAYALNSLSP